MIEKVLMWVCVGVFVATAVVTVLGILKKPKIIVIDQKWLKPLFVALILEIVAVGLVPFKNHILTVTTLEARPISNVDILGRWDMRWESVGIDNISVVFREHGGYLCGTYSWLTFNTNQRRYGCIKGTLNANVLDGEWFESEGAMRNDCEGENIVHEGQITLFFSADGNMCAGKYSRLEERNQRKYVWSGTKLGI